MTTVPLEIADQIVGYIYEESLKTLTKQREQEELDDLPQSASHWNVTLLRVRRTSKSFQHAVDRALFKEFKVDKLSLNTLVKTKKLLESPSICESIRTYTLSPRVCLVRPIVKKSPWGYYGEFASDCGRWEPSYSHLKNTHEMRQRVAKHYDEQLRLMRLDEWWTDWLWMGLERLMRSSGIEPRTTNLKTLPYFSSVPKLTNLKRLEIGYSIVHKQQDTRIHYLIKNDITAGVSTILRNAPPSLELVEIMFCTMTDLRNLVHFMSKGSPAAPLLQVKYLDLILTSETLGHRGRTIDKKDATHGHTSGGKPVADLLGFFPNLERLKLIYHQDYHDAILVLQDFNPPVMKCLKELFVWGFAIDPAALLKLTDGWHSGPGKNVFRINIAGLALFDNSLSWTQMMDTWNKKGLLGPKSLGLVHRPLRYLDRKSCTDESLSLLELHKEDVLHDVVGDEMQHLCSIAPTLGRFFC